MKQINMQYPNETGKELWDGKTHLITPRELFEFQIDGKPYFLLNYRDDTYDRNNMTTILSKDNNGNYIKKPLDNYSKLNYNLIPRLVRNNNFKPIDLNNLPNYIKLGDKLEVEYLINSASYKNKKNNNIPLHDTQTLYRQDDIDYVSRVSHQPNFKPEYRQLQKKDYQALYIAHIVDSTYRYIPTSIYNQYLTSRYDNRPNERIIDGVNCILVTQDDIDYVSRVSHEPNYKPEYRRNRQTISNFPPNNDGYDNGRDFSYVNGNNSNGNNPSKNDGYDNYVPDVDMQSLYSYVMDYPDNDEYPDLTNNPLWDGRTHRINPEELYSFSINGIPYYVMNYRDIDFDRECFALLSRNENDEIVKIPVDDYERLENIIDNSILTTEDLSILPHHIHLGEMLYLNELLGTMDNDRNTVLI